ncbi:MAG: UbiA family prenyltransferase, partial [Planctomycetota bacterium]
MDLKVVWRFMRPATLPAPAAGVIGGAVAASGRWPEDPLRLVLAVASALLLTGASNGLNQIADVDADRINRPGRPLPAGRIGMRQAWWIVAALLVPAVALAAVVDPYYLACVLITVPVTAAYSFPPVRTKRIPFLANATIATPRGLLLVLAGWAVGGGFWRPEA